MTNYEVYRYVIVKVLVLHPVQIIAQLHGKFVGSVLDLMK